MDDKVFDPNNSIENGKHSVNRILQEYWDDLEQQRLAEAEARQQALHEMAEEDGVRIYRPGSLRGGQAEEDEAVSENTLTMRPIDNAYSRAAGEPPMSVRDILRQYWKDNPQAMVDRVKLPKPKPPAPKAEEKAEPPKPAYDVKEILWEYWRQQAPEKPKKPRKKAEAKAVKEAAAPGKEQPAKAAAPLPMPAPEPEPTVIAPAIREPELRYDVKDILWEYWDPAPPKAPQPEIAREEPAPEPAARPEPAAEPEIPSVEAPEEPMEGVAEAAGQEPETAPTAQAPREPETSEKEAAPAEAESEEPEQNREAERGEGEPENAAGPETHDAQTEAEPEEVQEETKAQEEAEPEPPLDPEIAKKIILPEDEEIILPAEAALIPEELPVVMGELLEPEEETPAEPPKPRYAVIRDYHPTIASSPVELPESEQLLGGYQRPAQPIPDALDILKEYWTSGETSELEDLVGHIRPLRDDETEEEEAEPEAEEQPAPESSPEGETDPAQDRPGPPETETESTEDRTVSMEDTEVFAPESAPEERTAPDTELNTEALPSKEEAAPEREAQAAPEEPAEETPVEEAHEEPREEPLEQPPEEEARLSLPETEESAPARQEPLPYSMSVDDILAEYKMLKDADYSEPEQPRPKPKRPEQTVAEANPFRWEPNFDFLSAKPARQPRKPKAEEAEELTAAAAVGAAAATAGAVTGAAVGAAGQGAGAVSAMAQGARDFIASLGEEDYDRMERRQSVRPQRRGGPAIEPKKEPKKEEINYDELYNLSGREETMVFNGKELDLSPDESYVPPSVPAESNVFHWVAGEEELGEKEPEPVSFFQKLLHYNGTRKREEKKPLNAPRQYSDMPLPQEKPGDAPGQPESAAPEEESSFDLDAILAESGAKIPRAAARAADETAAKPIVTEREAAPAAESGDWTDNLFAEADEAPREREGREPDFTLPSQETPAEGRSGEGAQFQSFRDTEAAPAAYAPEGEYQADETQSAPAEERKPPRRRPRREASGETREPEPGEGEFPSFGQYLLSLVSTVLLRLKGYGSAEGGNSTMEADDEDLGPEVSPGVASRYYGSFLRSLRSRVRISLVVLAVMAYVALGLPVSGTLKTIQVAAGFCLAAQLTIMLLSLDVLTNAAINLARGRFGADSLAGFACVLTSFDALAVAIHGFGNPHMPLCLLSSMSLTGVLISSLMSARALRKGLRVPAIGKVCYAVTGEEGLKGKGITLLKSPRPVTGFVRRTEEEAPDESLWLRAAPALALLSLLFTVIVVIAKKSAGDFLYIFTAFLCPAIPLTALLAFAAPYFVGTLRIFPSGAAAAGWSGLCDIGMSQNLIVTDRDLFPEGSVEIDTIRIFADAAAEKIISYAGTMITASGSGIAPCFAQLMERNGGSLRKVDNFEYLPGGGMRGLIDGETVLCGGVELMRLMNVRIPYRLVGKTTVLLAIDGVLYGIFNMKYQGLPQVRKALVGLIRSNRHPIFAIRDFNVTPEMLHNIFDLATDGYDFPPYVERFAISEAKPADQSKIAAVVCREGLGPLVHAADTGRSIYVATRINLVISLASALLGVLLVFMRLLSTGSVSIVTLFLWLLLWALPVAAVSVFLHF